MKIKLKWTLTAGAALLGLALAGVVRTSRAAGIPPSGALSYSGLLQDTGGAPLASPQFVEVKLWNDPAATANANLLCDSGTPASVQLVSGHFSLVLPDACTGAVANNPNVYAEVLVGASAASAASLGRSKLGAVPYAVTSDNAVRAASAATADTASVAGAFTAKTKTFPLGPAPTANTAYKVQAATTVLTLDATGHGKISFPEPFPTGLVTVVATDSFATNQRVKGLDDDETLAGFTVLGTAGAQVRVNWIAIGW
ncbi:MAG TPA: hypothetical protein VG937_18630 [Polyangiaceae bacterium]|jgi:hypothetical protein|nr:hypothetical protein [Polyangiaceae bacterium]